MWNFIARSYQLMSKGKKLSIPAYNPEARSNSFFSAPGSPGQPGTATSSYILAPSPSTSMFDLHGAASVSIGNDSNSSLSSDHEKVLVALIKDVLRKYPSL